MFQLLLESNATPTSRIGGSLFSTVGHMAMVAAAVTLTSLTPKRWLDTTEYRASFVPVAPAPLVRQAPTAQTSHSSASSAPAHGAPSLIVAPEITLGLPSIDVNLSVSQSEPLFGLGGGQPDGTAASGAVGATDGSPWSAEQVDKPVILQPGAPSPAYPETLRSAGIAGSVVVEFVVDTLGWVEAGSLSLLQSDHLQFSSAVERVVPRLRFVPAEARGRKVRQRVRLPFRFDLHS